ncbi:MAG: AAA family ATPase, partial [Ktedonobacteraceae bacterium]
MKTRHMMLGYVGLLGFTTLLALLHSVQGLLPAIAVKVLMVLLIAAGLGLAYLLYRLYNHFHHTYHAIQTRRYELRAREQQLQIERERWQIERSSLLLAQQHQASRIYPDAKGYLPTLIDIREDGGYQYIALPHPVHQARLNGGQHQPLVLPEHASSIDQAIPTTVRYEEIRTQVPPGRSCLGVSAEGVEHCDFGQLMTMWICGGSGTGKSNTVALKIDEAVRNGRKIGIILVDPHARKEDSLYNKIRCYEQHFLCQVATSEEEILGALEWFRDEFERRLEQGGQGENDILLVVDEVSNVVESDNPEIGKLIKKIARICGQESRGFGMFGWFISQDAAGLAWLRKRAMTVIAHKLNMMSERKLACNEDAEIARGMDAWPRGRVAVYGLNFTSVMVAQMPAFSPPVVEGTVEVEEEMEPLQPLPNSSVHFFQTQ